jgi:single-strand DNA-binding protein
MNNQVVIIGKAWDPESRYSQAGNCMASVSVSVYDGKDQDGKAKYFPVTVKAFKDLAEVIASDIQRGDNVIVVGRMTQESWEKDGQKHRKQVVIADHIGKEMRKQQTTGGKDFNVNSFGADVFPESEVPW